MRRNAENLSETVPASPRALQRFLAESPWDDDAVIDRLQEPSWVRLEDPQGVWVLDGSDFPKQGREVGGSGQAVLRGVGQDRQPGVFLAHGGGQAAVSAPGVDCGGPLRGGGGASARRGYRSKTELALEMVEEAQARGYLKAQWVADSA